MVKEQLRVLYALDVAKTQWYHLIAVMIAGMGFFTYAYDIICISLVTKLLGRLYYHVDGSLKPGTLPPNVSAAVSGLAFCGTVFGQLFFGWLGDRLGRKRVYGITLRIMMFCSIGSGLSFGHTAKSVMTTLCFFRFWFGFAVGSDYPLSATIISEYSNKKTRGAFIAAVFAMQGFGILAGGIFSIFISLALKPKINTPSYEINPIGSTVPQADYVWRIILMAGALPACLTYYWRKKLPETPRYTALVARNAKQVARDMSKVLHADIEAEPQKVEQVFQDRKPYGMFSKEFLRRHGKNLLGTTSCWFILEVVFYSQYLNQKNVYSAIGWIPPPEKMNAIEEVIRIAKAQILIASCSIIPGYWFTVAFIDKMGRITIQLMGFFFMTVLMLVLALPRHYWTQKDHHISFLMLYSLMFFFVNFGPNVTTFVIPAEIFPSRFRSTCHGISSASGKLGAFVGALVFIKVPEYLNKAKVDVGMRNLLFLLAGFSFLGMLCTFLLPEPKGKSLEEISGENEDGTIAIGISFEKSSHIVKVPFT